MIDADTRVNLQRVAAHILGRRRFAVTGRFGLRSSPRGIATPAFGPEPEVLRLSGLIPAREKGGDARYVTLEGATLRELAFFAEVSLEEKFSSGADTPTVGDPDEPLRLDALSVNVISDWFATAWAVLDEVVSAQGPASTAATIQLWPEHFDAATSVVLPQGASVNLGFSPGDSYEPDPYAYVGPQDERRPGDATFWNAPFGAVLRSPADAATCSEFIDKGLRLLRDG